MLPTAAHVATARRKNLWPVKVPVVLHSKRPFGTKALASGTDFVDSANEGEDSISRIDLAPRRVTLLQVEKALPGAAPGGRGHAAEKEAGTLVIFDATRGWVVGSIPIAASSHRLRMSTDGREIYVAATKGNAVSVIDASLRDDDAVAVVDTPTRRQITAIPVGRSPIQLFATPDGNFVYVANQGTEREPDNTVSVIETRGNTVVKTLVTDLGAHGVVISDNGSRVFIANTFAGTVSTIDTATQRVIGSVRVGKGPGGITYRPGSR